MRVLVLVIFAVSLSSCIGENKEQVLASCRLQYSRSDGTLFEPEFKKIGLCMRSHGFGPAQLCADPNPGIAECFEPVTLENKIRAYVD
jgi:hypothetical protein